MSRTGAAVVLNAAHTAFLNPAFADWRETSVRVALDGRNVWRPEELEAHDIRLLAIGRG